MAFMAVDMVEATPARTRAEDTAGDTTAVTADRGVRGETGRAGPENG